MINLKKIEELSRKVFENSFEVSIMQEELESMLSSIYRNTKEFERGSISRNAFKTNESCLKKKSVGIIKNIKGLIKLNMDTLVNMKSEIEKQECEIHVKKSKKTKKAK